jgi:signal transduction histidine kinase
MKRLWAQLSLTFSLVIILSTVVLFVFTRSIVRRGFVAEVESEVTPRELVLERLPRGIQLVSAVSAVVGIAAGAWFSRRLTAPLVSLAETARAFGSGDLDQRVAVHGSQELVEVGQAFNQMAADLQKAEELRRDMVADAAHELRTPLSLLQGNLRAIIDDVYPLSKEEIVKIYEQTRDLTKLIEELHELAQADAHNLALTIQPVDVTTIVLQSADLFAPLANDEEVNIKVELADELPVIPADATRLRQVLNNLIANALRHTPAGGTITVEADRSGDCVRILVKDTGQGIAPEHLDSVFARFYRIDSSRTRATGGSGLGLAIVKAIVETHGGTVSVYSKGLGHGAIFSVRLPITRSE